MIEIITPSEARHRLDADGVALIGFKAPWCPQCEPQRGVVERLAPRYAGKVSFHYVDLEAYPEAQELFDIASLPAVLISRSGSVVERLSGFTTAPKLNAMLQDICG